MAKRNRSQPNPMTNLERKRREHKGCGCGLAGVVLNRETFKIERCDACNLFDTDADALEAVDSLLRMLGDAYEVSDTVADALDMLEFGVETKRRMP